MAPKPQVHLFFDCLSPYSYLYYQALGHYESTLPAEIFRRPVFMAAIFKETKNTGLPAFNPQKFKYMQEATARLGKYYGIPNFNIVDEFAKEAPKQSSAKTMRFVTAVQKEQPQDADRVIRELFQRLFIHNEWITSADALEKICKKLGLPTNLIDASTSEIVKKTLKDNTDEALANGAFGVPYVLLKNEGSIEHFFGVESLPQLCHSLGVDFKGPLKV